MSDSAQVSVTEAIRAVLAQAIKDGGCVNAAVSASVIAKSFPGSGETPAQLAERIAVAASRTVPQDEREAFWEATELLKVRTPAVRNINEAKASFLKPLLRSRRSI